MSFQIREYVKIVNPNHYKFGFEGYIEAIECRIGEQPDYRIAKVSGLSTETVTAKEYEIEKSDTFTVNTTGYQIGNINFEPNEFGGFSFRPINRDDAADSLKYWVTNAEYDKKVKGEYEYMKLLDLYEKKMADKIKAECSNKCDELKAQDDFTILRREYEENVKDLYEAEYEKEFPYEVGFEMTLETKETKEKIREAEHNMGKKLKKLRDTVEEIEAHLSIIPAGEYETVMKVLKKYGIVDKEGKLNV
jgi:hypothetical protein